MLNGRPCWNGTVEHEQWGLRWVDKLHSLFLKGILVFVLLAVLGILVLASISALVVDVTQDGYHRVPERELTRIL